MGPPRERTKGSASFSSTRKEASSRPSFLPTPSGVIKALMSFIGVLVEGSSSLRFIRSARRP